MGALIKKFAGSRTDISRILGRRSRIRRDKPLRRGDASVARPSASGPFRALAAPVAAPILPIAARARVATAMMLA
jgi:hypothetical protein